MRGLLQKDPARRMSHEQFFEHPLLKTNVRRVVVATRKPPSRFRRRRRRASRDDARNFPRGTAPTPTRDSDSDASESSETLAASDPRAIALGTDGGGENVRDETRSPRRAGVPGSARRTRRFRCRRRRSARARRRRRGGRVAGGVAARTEKGGSTFSKLLSSSPLSARKGMGLSGRSPRRRARRAMPAAPLAAPLDADAADEMDAEYVLVETETRRAAAVDAEIGPEAVRPGPVPEPDVAEARGRKRRKRRKRKRRLPGRPGARRRYAPAPRGAPRARRARAPRRRRRGVGRGRAAGRRRAVAGGDGGARAAALAWETSLRNEGERKATPEGFDTEDVAEASRRLDAAFEAALRRAERAASAAETMSRLEKLEF